MSGKRSLAGVLAKLKRSLQPLRAEAGRTAPGQAPHPSSEREPPPRDSKTPRRRNVYPMW